MRTPTIKIVSTLCLLMALQLNSVAQSTASTAVLDTTTTAQFDTCNSYPVITYGTDTGIFVTHNDARKMLKDYAFLDFLLKQRALDRARISLLERERDRSDAATASVMLDYIMEQDASATNANSAKVAIDAFNEEKRKAARAKTRHILINCIAIPSAAAFGFGIGWLVKK